MCDALAFLDTLLSLGHPPIPDRWAPVAYELRARGYTDWGIRQTVKALESGHRVEDLSWVHEWDRAGVREAAGLLETKGR